MTTRAASGVSAAEPMLRTRVATAAVAAPVVVAAVVLGEPWFSGLLGVLAVLALLELLALLDAGGFEPMRTGGLVSGLAMVAAGLLVANGAAAGRPWAALLEATDPPGLVAATLVAATLLLAVMAFARPDPRSAFVAWAVTSFGVAYVGLLLPAIALVGHLHPAGGSAATGVGAFGLSSGPAWAMLLVLVVWSYDSGAYLVGRWRGRHRLIEHISPSKTVEGVAGGLLAATLAAGVGALLVGLEPWHPFLIGPLLGLAAQAGDLAESLLKRAAGSKESGFLFPGHGGILDRIDSFLFAAPVLAGYALLVAGRVV